VTIPAVVLGASGYVGGELLRLLASHPQFQLTAAVSNSRNGQAIGRAFPNLSGAYEETPFMATDSWLDAVDKGSDLAIFSAAPHGASASTIASALKAAASRDLHVHVVDSSADFRYSNAEEFEAVYGMPHPEPGLLREFFSAVPEHAATTEAAHIGHPGCFATAVLLAAVPLVHSDLVEGDVYISGITGSTGSGRSPQAGTHHPERHSNLYAYKPLDHRHVPEIEANIEKACGRTASVHFVPHSGPFARGIYVTLQAALKTALSADEIRHAIQKYYLRSDFVRVVDGTPRLKDVIASNDARIGVACDGDTVVVMSVIDNLVKGAAGGAVQWMNRLWSLPESEGLSAAPPAWT
jgi:N-acetyl-gamma-glutamyl-phosphate reductase common form